MAIRFADWQNRNESRNYPLHDSASKQSIGGDILPDDILADIHLIIPRSAGQYVFIGSLAVSPALVSVTFLAAENDPFGTSSSALEFVPLAALTIQRPVTVYKNYAVTAIYPGVAGWVSFGTGAEERSVSLRFAQASDSLLVSKAARYYDDLPVQSLGRLDTLTELTGLVLIRGEAGVIKVRKAFREIDGVKREVLAIGLDTDGVTDQTALLTRFTGACGNRPEQRTCQGKSLLTINGVTPDCNGNIRIRITGLDATIVGVDATDGDGNLVMSGNITDLPLGLDDVCATVDPKRYDPVDLCAPSAASEISSSPSSDSSSSESPESSSSPAPSDDFYCDDFDDSIITFNNLTPKLGSWSVAAVTHGGLSSPRLLTLQGRAGPQVIIADQLALWKSGDFGYHVEGVIRPLTERGNGHIIFAYKNSNDFWFAGLSLDAVGTEPGTLYLGRKTTDRGSSLDNWPKGFNNGYFFIQVGVPASDFGIVGSAGGIPPLLGDEGFFETDIRVEVNVQPISPGSSIKLIQVSFAWDLADMGVANPTPFATIITTVSPQDSDLYGFCGMGVVGSETEFDDFGIDCPFAFTPPA